MTSPNQVINGFNKMSLEDKSCYKIDQTTLLGKIMTSMQNMESKKKLSALHLANFRLQTVLNKSPNAPHNKKITYLQNEYKEAKQNYNTVLQQSRGNR